MRLTHPFTITARLLPGLKVGEGFISLEYDGESDRRQRYRYHIDIPAGQFSDNQLKSGTGGGTLQEGFTSLLSFLASAVESYRYRNLQWTDDPDDNMRPFPREVVEWAYQNDSELQMLQCEIEEAEDLIEE